MQHKLTEVQQAEIEALAAMPDEAIDTSDIPPLDDELWKKAVLNPFYHPVKYTMTVQLDDDVLAWLNSQGTGYQARINEILRAVIKIVIPCPHCNQQLRVPAGKLLDITCPTCRYCFRKFIG